MLLRAAGLGSCNKEGPPEGMQNASTENAKFNLYVPEDTWLSTASSGISGARVYSGEDFSNVTVSAYYPEGVMTVEDYWNKMCLAEYNAYFKDFTLLESKCGDTTLGGKNAKRYVYEAKLEGDVTYRFLQVMAIEDTMVYTFTYTAKVDLYDTHMEDVEKMLTEFTFR
jgi:hypothetical protein